MGVHDVPQTELVLRTAEELKKVPAIKPPVWAQFAKTGVAKERPPIQRDWWYLRAASVLRKLFLMGPIGVSKLRTLFGSRMNRGFKPEHFYKGSGSVVRKIFQQLEQAGLAGREEKGLRKGRIISARGHQLLENIAYKIMKEKGIVIPRLPERAVIAVEKKPRKRAPAKPRKKAVKKEAPKEPKEKMKAEKVEKVGEAEQKKVEAKK